MSKPLTKKEWETSVAEMWSEAVKSTCQDLIDEAVKAEREKCIQNVLQQYEGFGTEHQGVEYVKQRIVEAIRARGKA